MQSQLMNHVRIGGRSATIFGDTLDQMNHYGQPHEFLEDAYAIYLGQNKSDPKINGMVFKLLVCEILKEAGATPFHCATNKLSFNDVPGAAGFDIILYDQQQPVVITCTTSLRERWKQADYKSQVLKDIYPDAESYLVTRDEMAAVDAARSNIEFLDDCVHSERQEFTNLVDRLARMTFTDAPHNIIPKRAVP